MAIRIRDPKKPTASAGEKAMAEIAKELAKKVGQFIKSMSKKLDQKKASEGAMIYSVIKVFVDEIDVAMKPIKSMMNTLKTETIPEMFDEEDVTSFTVQRYNGRYRVTCTQKMRASIKSAKKAEALQWLKDNGYGGLIFETVNAESLSASAREALENAKELPEDIFEQYIQNSTSMTRIKGS